jgi:hypothetical protein
LLLFGKANLGSRSSHAPFCLLTIIYANKY